MDNGMQNAYTFLNTNFDIFQYIFEKYSKKIYDKYATKMNNAYTLMYSFVPIDIPTTVTPYFPAAPGDLSFIGLNCT
jgi:hypothetical protein